MTEPHRALHAAVRANMRRLRKARGWSAERLGAEMAAAGMKWDRSIVASFECGRRASVSVEELAALAAVFGVDRPWSLTAEAPACAQCAGSPPAGFSCLSCGTAGTR